MTSFLPPKLQFTSDDYDAFLFCHYRLALEVAYAASKQTNVQYVPILETRSVWVVGTVDSTSYVKD